jgi:Ran GTPase-activating protein (RanGAP) involved in mRNA processing and transport
LTSDPEEKVERVNVSKLFTGKLENEEDVEEALNLLKDILLKLVAGGAKIILE